MRGAWYTLTPTSRLRWYTRRLGAMSVREVAWRSAQQGRKVLPRFRFSGFSASQLLAADCDWGSALETFRSAVDRPVLLDRSRAQTIARTHPEAVEELVRAAERVAGGRVTYFGYPAVELSEPIDWNYDPLHQFQWPGMAGVRINHRIAAADPKWIWELNRLQHLPWLAQAWLFTGRDEFAEVALNHLDSWIEQNPVGRGIAWRGAYEPGIRAISIVTALQGLRDSPALTASRFERVVRLLAASADQCWREPSLFSSANNHLVGELTGMAAVSMMVPELSRAAKWERRALHRLAQEAERQILPDGAGAEQAVAYQVLTAELLLLVAALVELRDGDSPSPIAAALDRSSEYLCALVGEGDPDPRYGDDDGGFALRLGPERKRTIRDHLGAVAALTGNQSARRAGTPTLWSAWLETTLDRPNAEAASGPHLSRHRDSYYAASGGMVVLRSSGRRIMMDVGPLGYLSIAAHGHADALAVTFSLDGQDVIGDPGTASYYGHPEWRRVHRGTRAHATVTVDDEDQSRIGGDFMWTDHAGVRVRSVDLHRGIVDAEHDGYRLLPRPVTHRRWLVAPPEESTVLVVDLVTGEGEHAVRVSWPLHPSLEVRPGPSGHRVERGGAPVLDIAYQAAGNQLVLHQSKGDARRNLGWWSEHLEERQPAWLVSATCRGRVPMAMVTVLRPVTGRRTNSITGLGVRLLEGTILIRWDDDGQHREVVLALT